MDPFKKSVLIHGFFIPLFLGVILVGGSMTALNEIQREFSGRKRIYDEMTQQDNILKQTSSQRQIIESDLPKIRLFFQPNTMSLATAKIASQCSDEKGLKLGDIKESTSPATKTSAQQIKLIGRSSPLIEILGEAQTEFPALQLEQWSLSTATDQKILSFQGTLNLVSPP